MASLHQLEIYYYVVRYKGISAAARRMPYGISQPAITAQIRALEHGVGTRLLKRWPHGVTPEGAVLYEFLQPFFDKIPVVLTQLRGAGVRRLSIASSPLVCRDYLPGPLQRLEELFPKVELDLLEGQQPQIEEWLESREADIAITVRDGRLPEGCRYRPLLELPLVLLAPAAFKAKSATDFWRGGRVRFKLLTPPRQDFITRAFRSVLARRSIRLGHTRAMNSIELIETYVSQGFGIGVSIAVPGREFPAGVRAFPLARFPKLQVGAFWHGDLTPVSTALLHEVAGQAARMTRSATNRRPHSGGG